MYIDRENDGQPRTRRRIDDNETVAKKQYTHIDIYIHTE